MKKLIAIKIVITLLIVVLSTNLYAQDTNTDLTKSEQKTVIDSVGNKLMANYIFPKVANEMSKNLQSKLKNGDYSLVKDPQEFATALTTDLQAISNDKHLRVMFAPERIAEQKQVVTPEDSLTFLNNYINSLKRDNFGFKEVKILGGNVGYLDLRSFSNVEYAGETAVAAMNFLSNTDAIIIDLRNNGGGSPQMIQLITSYLYGSEPVHLNNFYWRPSDLNTQTWTLPHVTGKRFPDTPVFVLTSRSTFSAAEEFSYNLKNLERATLIGETTGGGAHPGGSITATDQYMVWVPTGRAINPITNTNWEGTGVSPHIEVPSKEALNVAHIKALELLKKKDGNKDLKSFYEWPIAKLKLTDNPFHLDASVLKTFVGTYGPRVVTFEKGRLYYQRGSGTKYELLPFTENEFMLIGLDYFRIRFLSENGNVIALQGLYENRPSDKNLKSK